MMICQGWNRFRQKKLRDDLKQGRSKPVPNLFQSCSKSDIWSWLFGHLDQNMNYDSHPIQYKLAFLTLLTIIDILITYPIYPIVGYHTYFPQFSHCLQAHTLQPEAIMLHLLSVQCVASLATFRHNLFSTQA